MNKYNTTSAACSSYWMPSGKNPELRIDPMLMGKQWGDKPSRFRCSYCGTTFKSEPEKCEQCGARKFEVTR